METRRQGRRVSRLLVGTFIILAIVAAAVVFLTVFQIRNALVIGNERYSSDRIVSDLVYDFPTHNSLYLSWKYRTAKAEERTPYLSSVQVKITAPGDVQVIVQEKSLSGYVIYNSQNVYFDSEGIILEMTNDVYDGAILVEGISMGEPELYKKLPVDNTAQLRTVLSVNKLLSQSGLDVGSISFDDNQNVTAMVGTIEVLLGQDEYMEEKISNLAAIYKLQAGQTGVLNMSAYTGKNEPITFSNPDTEAPEPEETEGPGEGTPGGEVSPDEYASQGEAAVAAAEGNDADTPPAAEEPVQEQEVTGVAGFMVFDSTGTLRYDARVIGGQVVDAYGNPISGCSVNENGYVVDAYWNVIDPMTGTLAEQ